MSKRIDTSEIVDKVFTNNNNEKYKVLKYQFKEKNNHCYDIQFLDTGNIQLATLRQIRKGTCIDLVQRTKMKRIQTDLELKERNRLVKKTKNVVVVPGDIKQKRILSIDLATKSVGLAYAKAGKIERWTTIIANNKDFRQRAFYIVSKIIEMLEKNIIDIVIIEDTYLDLNSNILAMLSEVRGMLTYHIVRLKLELLLVPPIWWKNKKKFTDLPLKRTEQKEFMKKKFLECTGVEAESDDCADAYMMLKSVLEYEGV